MQIRLTVLATALLATIGCSSASKHPTPENTSDVVMSRIDDLSHRPDWLKESETFKIKDGMVYSLGSITIPGDHRVEAAYRIAENNAKAAIAGAIEQRLNFIFQNAEEGTAMDSTQARYIGAEASDLLASSIRPGQKYWEKVATTRDSGERITEYKVFAVVTMPEQDFKKAILDSARHREGKGGLSADFAQKVDQHWDKFVGGDAREPGAEKGE